MSVRTACCSLLLLLLVAAPGCVVRRPGAVESMPVETAAVETASFETTAPAPQAAPTARKSSKPSAYTNYDRPGFKTSLKEGRLWVFAEGSEGLAEFRKHGEPGKNVTMIGVGPRGMTLRGAETDTLKSYLAAYKYGRPGYAVFMDDGRIWVFKSGSDDMQEFMKNGEPAKSITLVGEGPDGLTLRSSDMDTARSFMAGR